MARDADMNPSDGHQSTLLLIAEGHGGEAALRGFLAGGMRPAVLSSSAEVRAVATHAGCHLPARLAEWIPAASAIAVVSGSQTLIDDLSLKRARFLNIHYSALPKYRGLHALVWAMLNGEPEVGVTIHCMSSRVDAGDIVWQRKVPVGSRTSREMMAICNDIVEANLASVVRDFAAGLLKPYPQDESQATFVGRRHREDCRVDWERWDVEYFERCLRALVPPYPRAYFRFGQLEVHIVQATVVARHYREIPGHVVYVDGDAVWIKLCDGLLRLEQVSVDGVVQSAAALLRRAGTRLH